MFYGVINENYNSTEYLEMELENSLLFFKSLDIVQESGIQILQESFSDIVEKVKELWKKFKEWVKGIWEKIKNFFGKFKKKSESNTEEKIVQSLQNPQVAPKGSDEVSDEDAEKAAKSIRDQWYKFREKQKKETDKVLDNLQNTKKDVNDKISERHKEAQEIIKDALKNIYNVKISNDKILNQIERDLDNLSKDDNKSMSVEEVKEIIKKRVSSTLALPDNSKIFYIEDKGYDDNWKNTEYMDFSEGCKKLLYEGRRYFKSFDRFPYYYRTGSSVGIGQQQAFNAEDTVKIDKEVEDFFTNSFGAFYNASDDEIVIKQKPKESNVQKFAKNLGDILIIAKQCANSTYGTIIDVNRNIDKYESQLDKFTKHAPIVSSREYIKAENEFEDNEDNLYDGDHPSKTMLVGTKNSNFDPSSIVKFIAKDIANMKKYVSLLSKINFNCVNVYNYDINLAKAKMFSDQIRRLRYETFGAPDKIETGRFNAR